MLLPIQKSWERVAIDRSDSDTALFLALMYLGEQAIKLSVSGFVATIADDAQRTRYRQLHRLVRADGIGDWVQTLEDVLTGPSSQYLAHDMRADQRDLTERLSVGSWQLEMAKRVAASLAICDQVAAEMAAKVNGLAALRLFAALRNRTRGHGAILSGRYSSIVPPLEEALRLFTENCLVFRRQWAFLHQNLSGKYRVTPLSSDASQFNDLRKTPPKRPLPNGVYIFAAEPVRVELVLSDINATDFFLPNGAFTDKRFEVISYLTDDRRHEDASPYLAPAQELPPSETEGKSALDVVGEVFTNLPPLQEGYIPRPPLEQELLSLLTDDRHPIVTLSGRGGIGKTSVAIQVLHRITATTRFDTIIWFSSRDIDLISQGPKQVKPRVLTVGDMAREFTSLMRPKESREKGFKPEDYFAKCLTKSPDGRPFLLVFDNFETVRNPAELFTWLSTYVRLPNKIVITTRTREFKADYPVDVRGMTDDECRALIRQTADKLVITSLMDTDFVDELIEDSDGHPYVIKIHLGEVAKTGRKAKLERVVASKDDILDALFERTYSTLTLAAQRVFLALCGWRSLIPELALEAVLTTHANEPMNVKEAVEDLIRFSLVEVLESPGESQRWLLTPLAASVFGRKKLSVSAIKTTVEADVQVLQLMGAMQRSDVRRGALPRIERLVRTLVEKMARQESLVPQFKPIVEFIAREIPIAWFLLTELLAELGEMSKAVEALQRYLESPDLSDEQRALGWERLANLSRARQDGLGEIHALVERAQLKSLAFREVTSIIARMHTVLRSHPLDAPERSIVMQKLIAAFESRLAQSDHDASDLSRLSWLYLRLGNEEKALSVARRGLEMDPNDEHCLALVQRLES